jgi:hypothetical protein
VFASVVGVGQPARCTATSATLIWGSAGLRPDVIGGFGLAPITVAFGVGQPLKHSAAAKSGPWLRIASISPPSNDRTPFSASAEVGVGHPVQPLSDVRRTDARRAQIRRPPGVTRTFQVSAYNVPPLEGIRACNLLAHNPCRAEMADEAVEVGPQVSVIVKSFAFAGAAEWLARARSRPDGLAGRYSRQL